MLIDELKLKYGLDSDPFAPNLGAFYDGAQRKHNLETLRHLAIFGDMVLLLTGDYGSGKTTLIERFSKLFSGEVDVVAFSAGSGAERISSIYRLAALSGLADHGKESERDVLARIIAGYESDFERSGKRKLLIVDDADVLPNHELELYLQVLGAHHIDKGVALLLVGLPKLMQLVADYHPQDREDWLHQVQLKPLSREELLDYVRCRFRAAGFEGGPLLSENELSFLAEKANGMPGAINELFPQIALGETDLVGPAISSPNRGAQTTLLVIASVLVLSFIFVSYQHGFFDTEVSEHIAMDASAPAKSEIDLAIQQSEERLAKLDRAIEKSKRFVAADALPLVAEIPPKQNLAELPTPVNSGANEAMENVAINAAKLVTTAISPGTKTEGNVLSSSAKPAVVDSLPSNQIEGQEEIAKTPAPGGKQANDINELPSRPYFKSNEWLMTQRDDNYSAQVLGSYNESTAIKFIEGMKGLDDLFYVQSIYKSKAWFVVLYGQYESKAQAKAGLAVSPDGVRRQKPWLRSFKGLKSSISQ